MKELLNTLYYEKFKVNERHRSLRNNHTFKDSNENIRNDQSIYEVVIQEKMINRLIDKCLEQLIK